MHFLAILYSSLASAVKQTHNFGPVSARDEIVYTACRPGDPLGKTDPISDDAVQDWISFMKQKGISKVISLLDDNEYTNYDTDLCVQFENAGFSCLCQAMRAEGASENINQYIEESFNNNEKVVAHCTGGVGRAGRVAAGWLVHKYGLTPTEATSETLAEAEKSAINRKGDVDALTDWLET